MRYVFIDCGFYVGCAIRWFQNTDEGKAHDWDIHAFEVCLLQEHMDKFEDVTFHKNAVWTYDGEIDFYSSGRRHGQANGLFSNPRGRETRRGEKTRTAKCIDFSKWLRDNFSDEDYIVIKMDIESAEYEVLEKMMTEGTLEMIDELYIEWHHREGIEPEYISDIKSRVSEQVPWKSKTFHRR